MAQAQHELTTIRMYVGDVPRIEHAPAGYSMVPRQVTRDEDLTCGAKVLLSAIIGLCYRESREIRATVQEIGEAAGMTAKRVRYFLPHLLRANLIARRPDPERVGGPWLTIVICDPRGFRLSDTPENWRVKRIVDKCTPPTHSVGRPLPTGEVDPYPLSGDPYVQKTLSLDSESPPLPPKGGEEGYRSRPRRRTRVEEIIDSYREWANESGDP